MGRHPGSGREAQCTEAPAGERVAQTIRCAVEYDGTAFFGFQVQAAGRTVAGEIERSLSQLFEEPVKITGAGRTDTGVHASGQVISFITARSFPFQRLGIALNSTLPADISARDVAVVADGFSARFSARERTYVYAILNRPDRSALLAHRAFHVYRRALDLEAMCTAAAYLIGEHDFRSFCGVLPESGVTIREVRSLAIETCDEVVRIEIRADGFLHRMVRTIVGTLVECGLGRRDPASMPAILAARDRRTAGLTAPAHGLYLAGVRYDDYDSYREPPVLTRVQQLAQAPYEAFPTVPLRVLYDDNVRAFYRRLASELPTAEERTDFEAQVASAELARKGETHDTFRFLWPYPDELRISVDLIDAIYADEDGADVNVIVHLVGGLLSWAERFRNDSNPIMIWPPPKDAPLRFPRYNP